MLQVVDVAVFVGIDVGKSAHHVVALDAHGVVLADRPLPQDEADLRELLESLQLHGPVLLVVDQPASMGALVVAVGRAVGVHVGYLPGLAMRRIADLHPGEAKTDARDALVIATAARSMPHALRELPAADEAGAELSMLCGFDDDLNTQIIALSNRLRGLMTGIHPALERVLGPHLDRPGVLDLLEKYSTPAALAAAGRARISRVIAKRSPRVAASTAAAVIDALGKQTVVEPGTDAAGLVIARLAAQLSQLQLQRTEIADHIEQMVTDHPLSPVLTSMPGVGVRTAARLITETHGKTFPTAGHLAAYAGLAPVSRRSGTSIHGEHAARGGNRKLKRVLFLSAFAALRDPESRAYYDRKRAQGKNHNQAILALARRRCDVLHAMIRTGTLYQTGHPHAA